MELVGLGLVFLLVVGIVILTVRGLFARDLTHALRRVTQREEELQGKAEILEGRLSQMETDHQGKLEQAEEESARLIQEAKQQAMNIRAAAIEEAKHRARQLVAETGHLRDQLTQQARQELDGQALGWACEALRGILSPQERASLHKRLITQLIEELNQLETAALAGQADGVQVSTATPLSAEQVRAMQRNLAAKIGRPVTVDQQTDAALVAGGVVTVGDFVVDGSLRHYISGIARHG